MRKYLSLLLVFALCVTLTGCLDLDSLMSRFDNEYEEYEELFELLEDEKFDAARAYIDKLENKASKNDSVVSTITPSGEIIEAPVEEAPAVSTAGLLSYIEITTVDNLGNKNTSQEEFFSYDSEGRIYQTDSTELQEYYGYEFGTFVPHFRFEYDASGVVSKITVMYHDDIEALLTPNYDDQGNLISTEIVTNTRKLTVSFTYDSNGNRLTGEFYDEWYDTIEKFTYTYDSEGRLIKRVYNDETPWYYTITTEYTYDESGALTHTRETWYQNGFGYGTWHISTDYFYNDQGKLAESRITSDQEGCTYAEKIVTYHYE